MRLPRGREKKGRPGKRRRGRRRPRRMPRGKLSWRSLKGRRGRRRGKLRRSWPEKEKRNKRLVSSLAVGEVVEVVKMMDPDLEVDLPGSQGLEDGEIENRRSRKNGVQEVEEEETEGLQDVDLPGSQGLEDGEIE